MSEDLFASTPAASSGYDASSIEVLEGLEPVRRRPGMYIGGTDERAYHHLAAEVLDNAMDEAVAGHATRIEILLEAGNRLTITDNGRGIPVDPHPKFPDKSALEVILSTLHSGGKFNGKAYATSGGLHGVGVSVVNALSCDTVVEVARNKELFRQRFSRGQTLGPLEKLGPVNNRRGTSVAFTPDQEIFGEMSFKPNRLFRLARSKAYLFAGVEIRWKCAAALISDDTPEEAVFQFPGGLADHLLEQIGDRECVTADFFARTQDFPDDQGRVEWAVAWPLWSEGSYSYYCNTIPTPDGGTHEAGLRAAIVKGVRAFGALVGLKKAEGLQAEDVVTGSEVMLSVFIRDPQFQSQTKDRLTSPEAARLVENAVRDHFDHFLSGNMERGKAGGSAKQARDRKTQAILPIRGKILNVASATSDKIRANSEIADLALALGCGMRKDCNPDVLRYERIIIMTDADVDGAHIATLLMTFFFQEMPDIVRRGHLYIAQPPLYRLTVGAKSLYARDDAHRAKIEANEFKGKKVEVSRFKGLGEMNPGQLKETTMDPKTRSLIRVTLPQEYEERAGVRDLVDRLMGKNPEHRFRFIQENASRIDEEVIDA